MPAPSALFLNGTVGVGKTTTANAVGDLLAERGLAHTVIDLDHLRRSWPAPLDDPFNHELELSNLTALVASCREHGYQRFVLAGVLEQAGEIDRYRAALGGGSLFICRLTAERANVTARLHRRHASEQTDASLAWHLERLGELDDILATEGLYDVVISTTDRTPHEVAEAVLKSASW